MHTALDQNANAPTLVPHRGHPIRDETGVRIQIPSMLRKTFLSCTEAEWRYRKLKVWRVQPGPLRHAHVCGAATTIQARNTGCRSLRLLWPWTLPRPVPFSAGPTAALTGDHCAECCLYRLTRSFWNCTDTASHGVLSSARPLSWSVPAWRNGSLSSLSSIPLRGMAVSSLPALPFGDGVSAVWGYQKRWLLWTLTYKAWCGHMLLFLLHKYQGTEWLSRMVGAMSNF